MPRHIDRNIAFLLLLVAFGLRAFRLDLQSIWSDEGLSIYRASQDLSAIPGLSAAGIHPPLYDSLLHFWIFLAGNREFSTRFFSLFFGVLAVALIFQVGRSLLGRGGTLLATLVAAASPFLVYYSQETRMYAPTLFFSLLSVAAYLRWLRDTGSRAWLVCYVAAAATAVYTHYYAWLIVAFLNLYFLLWVWASRGRALVRLVPWVIAQAALALAYLPWAAVLLNKYETYLTPAPSSAIPSILYQTLVSFGLGYSAGQAGATPGQVDLFPDHWVVLSLSLALLAVAIWGMVSGRLSVSGRPRMVGQAFFPLYLIVPLLLIVLLSWGKRDFAPRYLVFAAPAYYLLIGQGLASFLRTRKALGTLALLLVLGASALSLRNYYYDPTYWRDDMRGMAEFLNDHFRDGDAIVLNAYYLSPTFSYYYRGSAPVVGLPDSVPANWGEDLATLQELAGRSDRLWLVLWQDYYTDPERRVEGWLEEKAFPFQEVHFRGAIAVRGFYTRPPIVEGSPGGRSVGLQMGRTVELVTYDFPAGPLHAGEKVPFTLYWRALRPLSVDYTVFVHLVDKEGKSWSVGDSPPAGGGFPTTWWPVGALIADERRIEIPAEAPPGQYYLEMGMYDLRTMKRLGEGDPDAFQLSLGPLQIRAAEARDQP